MEWKASIYIFYILYITLSVIRVMRIMSAIQADTYINVWRNTLENNMEIN